MAKGKITLPNGTIINIEGTPEEIHKLIDLYNNSTKDKKIIKKSKAENTKEKTNNSIPEDYITQIVNLIKDCDESTSIEENIIDRISQVNRVLLPLYIIHKYMNNSFGLQSGEISKITKELGIPISQPNVSRVLSNTAVRYIMGNSVKKGKKAIKYKLNRRGVMYLKDIIQGESND
jgi:hypothetical protein